MLDFMFHKPTTNAIVADPKIQGATARYIGGLQNPRPVIPITNGTAKPTAMFFHINVVMPNDKSSHAGAVTLTNETDAPTRIGCDAWLGLVCSKSQK
jgi:hypothetical protein